MFLRRRLIFLLVFAIAVPIMSVIAYGGVVGSKHDLTNAMAVARTYLVSVNMDQVMNDYGEVCVYCHTPHSANASASAPLWNKPITTASFITYPTTMAGTTPAASISPESKVCLTCHDGTLAVDVVVNAPESGYNLSGPWYGRTQSPTHYTMTESASPPGSCTDCHDMMADSNNNRTGGNKCGNCHRPEGMAGFSTPHNAYGAYISTNLTNMHPISITYSAPNADTQDNPGNLRQTTYMVNSTTVWKSRNRTANPTISDVLINGKVECITCHDPHLTTYSLFLRATSSGSKICITCHDK